MRCVAQDEKVFQAQHFMSSAYILYHMITITCGKRRWMGKMPG